MLLWVMHEYFIVIIDYFPIPLLEINTVTILIYIFLGLSLYTWELGTVTPHRKPCMSQQLLFFVIAAWDSTVGVYHSWFICFSLLIYYGLVSIFDEHCCICFLYTHSSVSLNGWWWWFSRSIVSDDCNPLDWGPPGSSVHGILQARILE